ncbi:MAG: cupin-like domain-containing protein [Bacteroidia bacterium]|nr:cupin-like domain-containing protein [Bacteroidia bacterium]
MDLSLKIDVVENISRKDFMEKYHKPQRPVIIKGLLDQQPAGKKWSLEWFKQYMGDDTIELYDNTVERHKWSTTTVPDIKMPFREYLDIISRDEPTDLRMFLANLYKLRPGLREDFSCPPFYKNILGKLGFMFLGGKDTVVRGHYDVDSSCVLLTQVFGDKRVILFAPEYTDLLYKVPYNTHSFVDVTNPDYEKFPGLHYVKGYDLILEPGDSVYMPAGYWHFITYLNGGMGVSHRMMAPNVGDWIKGGSFMGISIPFDKLMNKWFSMRWYAYNVGLLHRKVNRAIAKKRLTEKPVVSQTA